MKRKTAARALFPYQSTLIRQLCQESTPWRHILEAPAGTGRTSAAAALAMQILSQEEGPPVLIVANLANLNKYADLFRTSNVTYECTSTEVLQERIASNSPWSANTAYLVTANDVVGTLGSILAGFSWSAVIIDDFNAADVSKFYSAVMASVQIPRVLLILERTTASRALIKAITAGALSAVLPVPWPLAAAISAIAAVKATEWTLTNIDAVEAVKNVEEFVLSVEEENIIHLSREFASHLTHLSAGKSLVHKIDAAINSSMFALQRVLLIEADRINNAIRAEKSHRNAEHDLATAKELLGQIVLAIDNVPYDSRVSAVHNCAKRLNAASGEVLVMSSFSPTLRSVITANVNQKDEYAEAPGGGSIDIDNHRCAYALLSNLSAIDLQSFDHVLLVDLPDDDESWAQLKRATARPKAFKPISMTAFTNKTIKSDYERSRLQRWGFPVTSAS